MSLAAPAPAAGLDPAALAAALAAAFGQAQAQAAPAPQAVGGVSAAALAAALAGLAGGSRARAAPPPPPPAAPLPPPPAWVHALTHDWLPPAASAPPPVPVADRGAAAAALGAALGAPAHFFGDPASPPPGSIAVGISGDALAAPALDAAVAAATAPARVRGVGTPAALAGVFSRAAAAGTSLGGAIAAAAARALNTALAADAGRGGDLFFESGAVADALAAAASAGTLPPAFFAAAIDAGGPPQAAAGWAAAQAAAFAGVARASLADLPTAWAARLAPLDALTAPPPLARCLAATLAAEAAAAPGKHGAGFEAAAALAPLLRVSPVPDAVATLATRKTVTPARAVFEGMKGYPERYGEAQAAARSLAATCDSAASAALGVADRVARCKAAIEHPAAPREALVAWLAAAASACGSRASRGDKGALDAAATLASASDAFALGATGLALRLCRPFLEPDEKWFSRFDPSYYADAGPFRLPGAAREPRLDGNMLDGDEGDEGGAKAAAVRPFLAPDPAAAPHFVADCFFLAQRFLHVGFMPAVNRFLEGWDRLARSAAAAAGGPSGPRPPPSLEEALFRDSGTAALTDPHLASDACRFAVLTLVWLGRLLETGGPASLTPVPAHALRDACGVLASVVRLGGADLVGACNVSAGVAALAALLRAPRALGPLAAAAAVDFLQAALAPSLDPRRRALGGPLGPAALSPGERALVATVLAAGGAPGSALVPALMRAHAGADVVVGLDVDRDRFDKFGFRSQVDSLLMELWNDGACLASTAALAAAAAAAGDGDGGLASSEFGLYLESVLNSLIYLLEDCLTRLKAIRDVEAQQEDAVAWAALDARARHDKEAYLAHEGHVTRSFMSMAISCLSVLARISATPSIAAAMDAPHLAAKVGYAAAAAVNAVAGPAGADVVKLARPERFRYDPPRLLASVAEIVTGLAARSPALATALAGEADFDAAAFAAAAAAVGAVDYGLGQRLEALSADVLERKQGGGRGGAAAAAPAAASLDLSLPTPPVPDLDAAYKAALSPLAFEEWDSTAPGAFTRAFAAAGGGPPSRKAVKRVARELRELAAPGGLPLSPAASILIRADPDRGDRLRALVTGPEGTPYFGACFVFDALFPPAYPDVPPLLMLDTTGGGRARFNPNLYADGKVCLSLLGTWHGSHASEKWDAETANLWRVLVSIQGMILVGDPYFNEPGVEAVRGTKEGDAASARYNARLATHVVRFAINGVLDAPPAGFADAVIAHFTLVRHALLAAAGRWVADADAHADSATAARLREEVAGMRDRLAKL